MVKHNFVLEEYIHFLKSYPYNGNHYHFRLKDTCIDVSYLEAEKETDTYIEIDDNISYSVSGNNIDGYIITEWRMRNEKQ